MYQVLYRKYRPRVFGDVYGQDHVTSTLRNEISGGRVSHAYLFTGSRGTGKTTCAKILAKAVNCENPQNGEPCNECEVCRGIDNGSIYDVVEIDAASNNGVDNIRDLREEANYTPTRGKYRVYIIDEVHMLSMAAFNALLKTLEEPPAHIIFILATTEVHKLPATILSRCQRFDFKRIQPATMAKRLNQVAELEGITLENDAALLIARIADGALRDGLSILDQCAGRTKNIDVATVSEVAGLAGKDALFRLSDCIAAKDSSSAVSEISALYQNSYDMEKLCTELISHFRNFLVVKTVKNSRELIVSTDDEYERTVSCAEKLTLENVIFALDLFQNTLVTIKSGAAARIEMEMALVKLCEPKLSENINAVLDRISALERAVKTGTPVKTEISEDKPVPEAKPEPKPQPVPVPVPKLEPVQEPEPMPKPPVEEQTQEPEPPVTAEENKQEATPESSIPAEPEITEFTGWGELMDELRKNEITLYSIIAGSKGYVRGDMFLIDSPNTTIGEFIKKNNYSKTIKLALYNITGKQYKLGLFKHRSEDSVPRRDPLDDLIMKAQSKIDVDLK